MSGIFRRRPYPPPRPAFIPSVPRSYTLSAEAGSYTLTGQAASLLYNRVIAAASGTFTLTGQAASFVHQYNLTAASGAYTLSGQAAGLVYTPNVTYTLTAASGTFTLTGQAAGLLFNRVLGAASGAYTLTGQAATLTRDSGQATGGWLFRSSGRRRAPLDTAESDAERKARIHAERVKRGIIAPDEPKPAAPDTAGATIEGVPATLLLPETALFDAAALDAALAAELARLHTSAWLDAEIKHHFAILEDEDDAAVLLLAIATLH